jgi:YfiH family protein
MRWQLFHGKNIDYLTIPEWSELGANLAFSLRDGGVSKAPYCSLNLALHVDDSPENVLQNRRIFLEELGCSFADCTAVSQVHGNKVIEVGEQDKGIGVRELDPNIPECDGMVTTSNIALLGFYADCVPLYFFEPQAKIVGLAHAGWKGTALNINQKILHKIQSLGGSLENCLVAIGPCIGPCCYEVGEEVATVFTKEARGSDLISKSGSDRYSLDLAGVNKSQLIREGICPEHIVQAPFCTACHKDLFYSYRREGSTGRMGAFIQKK